MNIALIVAGGVGNRFGANRPKQFVEVNGKPILLFTLSVFQQSPHVDKIAVVCIDGWHEFVEHMKDQYNISKLSYVIEGGASRFESIYNGLLFLKKKISIDDYIMIHDSVRPCITDEMIEDSFKVAAQYGAALAVAPCFDTMFISDDGVKINGIYPREKLFKGQTPETIRYEVAIKSYQSAKLNGLKIDSPTSLLMQFEQPVGLSRGSQGNIKITTQDDIILFKSILDRMEARK